MQFQCNGNKACSQAYVKHILKLEFCHKGKLLAVTTAHKKNDKTICKTQYFQRKKGCKEFLEQQWSKLTTWLLEVEMGVVWGIASLSIISFIFASIWYIDPALLTMVLQFQAADCTTVQRYLSK